MCCVCALSTHRYGLSRTNLSLASLHVSQTGGWPVVPDSDGHRYPDGGMKRWNHR